MNDVNFLQSSIWMVLISINLFLIWKFVSMNKELKSPINLGAGKQNEPNSSQIVLTTKSQFNFQELNSIIDEIKEEEDLKKHYKIQKLMMIFDHPVQSLKSTPNIEIQSVKKEIKRKKPDFRTKLLFHHPDLTEPELLLCELIIKEKSCSEIAEKLDLSNGTVRVYKNKLKTKLSLSSNINLNGYLGDLNEFDKA